MIVMKFGGTSVGNAAAIKRVSEIIRLRLEKKPVVILSAVTKITDKLIKLSLAAGNNNQPLVRQLLLEIEQTHKHIFDELGLSQSHEYLGKLSGAISDCQNICHKMSEKGEVDKLLYDELLSYGEYLSTHLLVVYLQSRGIPSVFADAREIMVTDSTFGNAQPKFLESAKRARAVLLAAVQADTVPVMQGFIGRDAQGHTTILGRGGSDYSATLIGAMLEVQTVEIWTDVDGVMTADPSLVPEAKRIRFMSFQEAAELAYFGAKVLHPATILPAVERNIPVIVLNSMHPQSDGTTIAMAKKNGDGCVVKSIAYKEKLSVVTVTSTRMLMAYGFMLSIFEIFNRYQTSIDLVSTSEVSVSVTVDNIEHLNEIVHELSRFAQVEVEYEKAIVCLVGEGMKDTPGMPSRIFGLLEDVRIYLISQGASDINISFVIDDDDLPRVIRELHDHFFSDPLDPALFD
jgi:aspartate kinase